VSPPLAGRGNWLGVAALVYAIVAIATLPGCAGRSPAGVKSASPPGRESLNVSAAPGEHTFAVLGQARALLEAEWSDAPDAKEKAFCVLGWSRVQMDETSMLLVHRVERAAEQAATTGSVRFSCHGRPEIHSHPAFWCGRSGDSACVLPPPGTFCRPSENDYAHLVFAGAPFGIIQCAKSRFVVYLPPGRQP
jgi:hypothetical protein